jgi:hypothetical protein
MGLTGDGRRDTLLCDAVWCMRCGVLLAGELHRAPQLGEWPAAAAGPAVVRFMLMGFR